MGRVSAPRVWRDHPWTGSGTAESPWGPQLAGSVPSAPTTYRNKGGAALQNQTINFSFLLDIIEFVPHSIRVTGQVWGPEGAGAAGHTRPPPKSTRGGGQDRGACAGRGAGGRPRSLLRAGLRGNGPAGGRGEGPGGAGRRGCYFCRFLFLAATSPWQRCYSARPLPGSAGARDPGRPRPLVSHLPCSPLSPWRPARAPPRSPSPSPSGGLGAPTSLPPPPRALRGPRPWAGGGRLMGDAY